MKKKTQISFPFYTYKDVNYFQIKNEKLLLSIFLKVDDELNYYQNNNLLF